MEDKDKTKEQLLADIGDLRKVAAEPCAHCHDLEMTQKALLEAERNFREAIDSHLISSQLTQLVATRSRTKDALRIGEMS
jgi:hypothetical protein